MTNIHNLDGSKHSVLEFKSHGKRQQLEIKMGNLQRMLEARYNHINELLEKVEKIEKECTGFETKYNKIIVEYAERIGAENVDPKWSDFSTALEFKMDEHGVINMLVRPTTNEDFSNDAA